MSRSAVRRLGYINHAVGRKGHDQLSQCPFQRPSWSMIGHPLRKCRINEDGRRTTLTIFLLSAGFTRLQHRIVPLEMAASTPFLRLPAQEQTM
jgi:hypothetical protein